MTRAVWIAGFGLAASVAVLTVRRSCVCRSESAPPPRVTVRPDPRLPSAPAEAAAAGLRPLARGEAVPDAELVSHEGKRFRLSDLKGQIVALAFIYTHCNIPSMCPLATAKLVETQDLLKQRKTGGVRILVVSFDPERDTPETLREYAGRYGVDSALLWFAAGEPSEVGPLCRRFNTYYRQSAPGVFDHNIVVSLVDRQGILRDDFFGTSWEAPELAAAIEELVQMNPRN